MEQWRSLRQTQRLQREEHYMLPARRTSQARREGQGITGQFSVYQAHTKKRVPL